MKMKKLITHITIFLDQDVEIETIILNIACLGKTTPLYNKQQLRLNSLKGYATLTLSWEKALLIKKCVFHTLFWCFY